MNYSEESECSPPLRLRIIKLCRMRQKLSHKGRARQLVKDDDKKRINECGAVIQCAARVFLEMV